MRQRSGAAALLACTLLVLQLASVDCARGKPVPAKAPPPPPPPPPKPYAKALDASKAFAASVAGKLPSRTACVQYVRNGAKASVLLASRAAASSHRVASKAAVRPLMHQPGARAQPAVRTPGGCRRRRNRIWFVPLALPVPPQAHLAAAFGGSKFSAPVKALAARLVTALQKPALAQPLAVVALFGAFVYLLRGRDKLYARAALCTAFVNWLSFSFLVNTVATVVVGVLTALELVVAHPSAFLCLAGLANAAELRRVASMLPARRKRATFAPAVTVEPEPAAPFAAVRPASAAPAAAPAARVSAAATPDAPKVKPTTPVPGAPKTSPVVRTVAK